jgi:hypothetical protein
LKGKESARGAAAVLALVAGAATAARLLATTWPLRRLPLWDGAGNGWGAVELWAALADGRLVDFVVRLNAQDKWPFGFSLLMLPFVALGGASFEAATLLPALAFALVPALLVWLAREIDDGTRGLAAGAVGALLWLASPLPRALATVVMRETTGAALTAAALAAYLRARRLGTLAAWRLCGILLLLLFFTKYNYFLLGGTALALHAWLELDRGERWARLNRARDTIVRGGWRSPVRWAALVGAFSIALFLAGENPGNLIYGAIVLATVLCLSLQWKSFGLWRDRLREQPPARRALIETLAIPLWFWSLSPRPIHPRNVFAFLRNRPGDLPVLSAEALSFQPERWVIEYFAPWSVGVVASLVALPFLALALARGGARRALALAALVGFVAVSLHPMKEARFLATVAPALLLATAFGLSDALNASARRLARPLLGFTALGVSAACLAVPFVRVFDDRLRSDHRQLTVERSFAAPLDELARRAMGDGRGDGRGGGRVAFLGATNELSESLLFWRSYALLGRELAWAPTPKGIEASDGPDERRRRVRAWVERERPRRLVTLVPFAGSRWLSDRDYLRYNAWQVEAVGEIVAGGGWRRTRRRSFGAVDLRVVTWVRRADRTTRRSTRDAPDGAPAP